MWREYGQKEKNREERKVRGGRGRINNGGSRRRMRRGKAVLKKDTKERGLRFNT